MFAKLSALALFVSFVSALQVSLDASVKLGAKVALDVAIIAGDPIDVGLVLIRPDVDVDVDVDVDLLASVRVGATIDVTIPIDVTVGDGYVIACIEPGNRDIVYATTEVFLVVEA